MLFATNQQWWARVDKTKGAVTLAHEPIATLNWPAMTMAFKVTDVMLYDKLLVGKKVEFTLKKTRRRLCRHRREIKPLRYP